MNEGQLYIFALPLSDLTPVSYLSGLVTILYIHRSEDAVIFVAATSLPLSEGSYLANRIKSFYVDDGVLYVEVP